MRVQHVARGATATVSGARPRIRTAASSARPNSESDDVLPVLHEQPPAPRLVARAPVAPLPAVPW